MSKSSLIIKMELTEPILTGIKINFDVTYDINVKIYHIILVSILYRPYPYTIEVRMHHRPRNFPEGNHNPVY